MNISPQKKEFWLLILLVLFALGLRLGYDGFLKNAYFFYNNPGSDVMYYQNWAHEIASGNWIGDKTFFGLPLYPYCLGLLERLCLGHPGLIRFAHLLIGSLNCVLIFIIAKKIFSARIAWIAAILAATNFMLIYYDWLMMPVPLIIMLTCIIILGLLHKNDIKGLRDWVILGLLIGLAILGDGKLLFFFALLLVFITRRWDYPLAHKIYKIILPLTLGVCLVLFSVALRNRIIGKDWVMISAQSGLSFYTGNNKNATGVYEHPFFLRPNHTGQDEDQHILAESILKKKLLPGEVSAFWQGRGLAFIVQNPGDYLKLLAKKVVLFLSDAEQAHDADLLLQQKWRNQLDVNPYFVICPLALLGMILAWNQKKEGTGYLNLVILSQLIMTLIFFMSTRHRATILPFLLIYEAFCLDWLTTCFYQKKVKSIIAAAFFISFFTLVFRPQKMDKNFIKFIRSTKAGIVYQQKGDFSSAIQSYKTAVNLRPYDSNTLYNLGTAYLLDGNIAQAQQFYHQVLDITPYNVDALFNLGVINQDKRKFPKALKYFQMVLHYQPQALDAHLRIAEVYKSQNNCAQAMPHYNFITQHNPGLTDLIQEKITECQNNP